MNATVSLTRAMLLSLLWAAKKGLKICDKEIAKQPGWTPEPGKSDINQLRKAGLTRAIHTLEQARETIDPQD